MRLIFGLFILAVLGLGFWVWRTIARSPKLDGLFNFSKREENAIDILERRRTAEQDLDARGRTLGKKQRSIDQELNRIRKNK